MALTDTVLTSAPLIVTIEEKCNIAGIKRGSKTTVSIPGITDLYTQIVSVPTAGIGIAAFDSAPGSSKFKTTMKYLRITNKDGANFVTLTFVNALPGATNESHVFSSKLEAGKSLLLGSTAFEVDTDEDDHMLGTGQVIKHITAKADTAAVDIELVIGEG